MNRNLNVLPLVAVVAACMETSPRATTTDSATTPRTAPVVSSVRVNEGTYGMSSRVKWWLSPDSSAIIAVVDPVGVESEPIANGFFYGSESRNFQTRMDSVWDVAPSPDWGTIAFSRAYVMSAGGEDSIPASMWAETARRSGIDVATVRSGSFASSGMAIARAIAQPGVIRIPENTRAAGAADDAAPHMFPIAIGWNVRWTPDGSTIALGSSPARSDDNESSKTWAALDPKTGALHTSLPVNARLVEPRWVQGPVLDMSVPIDLQSAPAITVHNGARTFSIESARGVITARETTQGTSAAAREFPIGSGKVLAATKGGRYILALAPRTAAVANDIPVEAVVYVVGW